MRRAILVSTIWLVGGLSIACSASGPARVVVSSRQATAPRRLPQRSVHASSTVHVPILMYHVIGEPPAGVPYPTLWLTPARFRSQVAWLVRHGYRAVTLRRVVSAWHGQATLPARPVVLTFDDGYAGDVTYAAPVLERRGWPGVLDLIGSRTRPGDAAHLTAGMVRGLLADGWELDSHTVTHPDLTTLSASGLRAEIAGSRTLLTRIFRVPVTGFCYPYGRFDRSVVRAVHRAGYAYATTELQGVAAPSDDPLRLPRVRIRSGETGIELGRQLRRLSAPPGR